MPDHNGLEIGAASLDKLEPGRTVKDSAGDMWTKLPDGYWTCDADPDEEPPYILTSYALLRVWGPVEIQDA